eukprot:scaffold121066_cov63-Phaeocystis_antarctica.AAC.2
MTTSCWLDDARDAATAWSLASSLPATDMGTCAADCGEGGGGVEESSLQQAVQSQPIAADWPHVLDE